MKVIRKLTLANLKQNKRRTIITILGTAVAVAMITALAVLLATVLDTARKSAIAENGLWHLRTKYIDMRALSLIDGDNIDYIDYFCEEGFALLPGREGNTRNALSVVGYTPESYARLPVVLSEGRLPEKPGEIVLSEDFLRASAEPWPVGETVELDFGYYGYPEIAIRGSDAPRGNADNWQSEGMRRFTVVGYGDLGRLESGWQTSFTALTVLDPAAVPDNGYFLTACIGLRDVKSAESDAYALTNTLNSFYAEQGAENTRFRVEINSHLLGLSGVFTSVPIYRALAVFCTLLLAVILGGSISLIGNAFSISLAERVKSLGMMASVGATKRQKRGSVLFEAAVIGLFAIPLGLLAGVAGIGFTLLFLGQAIGGVFGTDTIAQLVVPWQAIMFAVLFSALMLMLSAWRPARLAAKIGPIDAVRGAPETLIAKKAGSGRLVGRLFGFEAALGIRNSKRNRRRYRAILSSLAISLVLFLVGSAAMGYLRQSAYMVQGDAIPYNAAVDLNMEPDTPFDDYESMFDFADKVRGLPDAGQSMVSMNFSTSFMAAPEFVPEETRQKIASDVDGSFLMQVSLRAMDDESFAKWCEQAGLDAGILQTGSGNGIPAVLLSPVQGQTSEGAFEIITPTVLDTGDIFSLPFEKMGVSASDSTVDVVAISPTFPENMRNNYYLGSGGAMLFVTTLEHVNGLAEVLWKNGGAAFCSARVDVQSVDAEAFYFAVERMEKPDGLQTMVYNVSDDTSRNNQILLVMEVFTYGFVVLITLVCLANIFNAVSTGMLLRAKEFAVLRSCGLTPQGFNRMTDCETLFYGLRALAIGLPLSVILSWLLYRALGIGFSIGFALPWAAYIAAVLGVFVVVGLSMFYARSKMKKLNIAEAMKNENW